jgi:hypothetical protein
MDPTASLIELLALVADLQEHRERGTPSAFYLGDRADDVDRVLELVNALDQWLRAGGALPQPWLGQEPGP